ncbi:PepSY domain-containing protein [Kitasatospora saccharophila]|uniref:PepSY domain-containing protein n=1 Tax=Kitasatospora saccharophila TaxID=407973 RepID=UPI0031DE43D8
MPVRLRGRAVRWGGGVAVAALLLGGAAAVAAAGHHERHELHGGKSAARGEEHGRGRHGERHDRGGRDGRDGRSGDGSTRQDRPGPTGPGAPGSSGSSAAPAPLPALAAADAVAKATAAVPDGRAESLRPAPTADGGRAWQVVVLGPDGVRHLVTVDGTTGALTGNTVLNG